MILEGPITFKKIVIKTGIWFCIYLLLSFFFENYELQPHYAYIRALYHIFFLMLIFYSTGYLIDKLYIRGKQWQFFLVAAIVMFILSIVNVKIASLLMDGYGLPLPDASPKKPRQFVFFTSLFAVAIGTFLFIIKNKNRKELNLISQINEQKEAQLNFLKSQINPHFLFNTLNNIYSLAHKKSDKTPDMILLLSEILRYAIYESRKTQVFLSNELEQVKKLIQLYKLKTEYPNKIEFIENGDFQSKLVEPMILVPLVENCLKHSDVETNPNGYIKIEAKVEKNKFTFKTNNSYDPRDVQRDKDGGVGLENIKKRLSISHANNHKLVLEKLDNNFTVVLEISNPK